VHGFFYSWEGFFFDRSFEPFSLIFFCAICLGVVCCVFSRALQRKSPLLNADAVVGAVGVVPPVVLEVPIEALVMLEAPMEQEVRMKLVSVELLRGTN
jgi:hypothetical protein